MSLYERMHVVLYGEFPQIVRDTAQYVVERDSEIISGYLEQLKNPNSIDPNRKETMLNYLTRHADLRRDYLFRKGNEEQLKQFDRQVETLRHELAKAYGKI